MPRVNSVKGSAAPKNNRRPACSHPGHEYSPGARGYASDHFRRASGNG